MLTRRTFYFSVNQRSLGVGRHNAPTVNVSWRNGVVFLLIPDPKGLDAYLFANTDRAFVDRFRAQDPELIRDLVEFTCSQPLPEGWRLYDVVVENCFYSELQRERWLFEVLDGGQLNYESSRGGLYQIGQTLKVGWIENSLPLDSDLVSRWEEVVAQTLRYKRRKRLEMV